MNRRAWPPVLCVAAFLAVSGCGPRNQFIPPPPPTVTVAPPHEQSIVESMEFTGNTRASARVDLRTRVNGYLQQVVFQDGAIVQAGELLFVIEPAPFEAELEAAAAQVQKAEANLQLAVANLARTERLREQDAATEQQIDIQKAEKATAEADVATAKASRRQAELNLSYTEIRAPMTGRIGRHLVDIGNLVQAETTPLAIIEALDPIHVYFYVSESDLLRFMEMIRDKRIPDPTVTPPPLQLGLANEDGFPHHGQLDFRELGVDPGTGTVLRRATFPNPDRSLIPGLFVRIRAEIGDPLPKLLVEERALAADQRGDYVLVVNDKNIVEYRPVKLGIAVNGLRVIEQGISAGDRVVVNGLQRARPGAEVKPETAVPAQTAATDAPGVQPVSAAETVHASEVTPPETAPSSAATAPAVQQDQ
ncbi:MAG: efflux RND transporter periplasmic adaptor subunit [Planctomycetaceae bacterium]|nr:efflux RND transporter periplasmic adaptor subunit [Planctomycetaceae bacterium]